ncbi:MAG: hypothetical protein M1820_001251 [Bogoriella megaspora]|nr:MAG: hypothetical protein M1820_001251 [Bogoriella megaspora]
MRFLSYTATLLSVATTSVKARSGLRSTEKYDKRRVESAGLRHWNQPRASGSIHLTNSTAQYAVNGTALPDVNFDIGESYAGLLPIDDTGKELFFWYVPSTNPNATEEIVLWLNGGPGCSSLDGFFHENGPAIWQPGTYLPTSNTYSWTNLTNVVWVEQPVGTGYTQGTPNATSEVDVGIQFLPFWKNFIDTFDLQNRKVYVTGESYAGQYVPYIADAMLSQNDTTYFDVNGILIYDPSIGYDAITEQAPTLAFTEYHQQLFPFNETFKASIQNASAACGYDDFLSNGLQFPPSGPFAGPPGTGANGRTLRGCDIFDTVIDAIFEINPCFDIYQVGQLCPIPWDVLGFPYSDFYLPAGFDTVYFDRQDVKEVIHAPLNSNWSICSDIDVFPQGDSSPPSGLTGGPIQRITEKTNNTIIGHGILDMVLIANGSLLTLQNLTWNGAQGFSSPPNKPFYVPYHDDPNLGSAAGAGVYGSFVTERGLTFVTIDLGGHEVPEFQPSAAYRHLELLLGRISSLDEVSPFTTQPDIVQPNGALGSGTDPLREQKKFPQALNLQRRQAGKLPSIKGGPKKYNGQFEGTYHVESM